MLDITDNHRFLYYKLNWSKVLDKERYLSINDNKFLFNGSEGYNFFDEYWLFFDNLFVNRDL
jgi:hypothetical protein